MEVQLESLGDLCRRLQEAARQAHSNSKVLLKHADTMVLRVEIAKRSVDLVDHEFDQALGRFILTASFRLSPLPPSPFGALNSAEAQELVEAAISSLATCQTLLGSSSVPVSDSPRNASGHRVPGSAIAAGATAAAAPVAGVAGGAVMRASAHEAAANGFPGSGGTPPGGTRGTDASSTWTATRGVAAGSSEAGLTAAGVAAGGHSSLGGLEAAGMAGAGAVPYRAVAASVPYSAVAPLVPYSSLAGLTGGRLEKGGGGRAGEMDDLAARVSLETALGDNLIRQALAFLQEEGDEGERVAGGMHGAGGAGGVGAGGANEEAAAGNQGGQSVSGGSGSGISLAAAAAAAAAPAASPAAAAAAAANSHAVAAITGRAAAPGTISSLAAFPRFSTNNRTPSGATGGIAASAGGGGGGGGGGVAVAPALAAAGFSRTGLATHGGESDRKRAAEEDPDGQTLIPHKRQRAPAKPSASEIPPDGWEWRKYGQKATLGQLYPRSYFRVERGQKWEGERRGFGSGRGEQHWCESTLSGKPTWSKPPRVIPGGVTPT
ncbi:unnamed protein product [Closterium sp. NIES-65]|nr:unnamed protein product [Closterium sp. NIES-65]